MTLEDKRKSCRLDNCYAKGISEHKRKKDGGRKHLERSLPGFLESERKGGEKWFQASKIMFKDIVLCLSGLP